MKNTITQDAISKKYGSLNSESEKLKFMQKMVYEMVDENYGGKIENFNILKNPNPGYIISGFFETPRMGGKRLIMGFDIGKDKIVLAPQNPQVLAYSEESETYYVAIKMALEFSERVNYLPLEFFNFAQKQMNCVKGWSCKGPNGFACLAQSKKNCNNPLNPAHATYAGWLADQISTGANLHSSHMANAATLGIGTKTTPAPKPTPTQTPTPTPAPTPTPIGAKINALKNKIFGKNKNPTNKKGLFDARNELIQNAGQKAVDDAENNVKKILDSNDTQPFIRVSKSNTLELILGSEFKNAHQLGKTTHNIPDLLDKNYLKARSRVEKLTNGIPTNASDTDRPISAYLGSNDLTSKSHQDVAIAYGSISIKLKKDAVKDRMTFTASDSFKSGYASDAYSNGNPPPPDASSLIPMTRHGYKRDKLLSHYPSSYASTGDDKYILEKAAKAKNIDDLSTITASTSAGTGKKYVEAQVHGGVKPSDIAEIHFSPKSTEDQPTPAIATWAKKNGVDIFINGKKADLDKIINPPKTVTPPKPAPQTANPHQNIADAIKNGDIDALGKFAEQLEKETAALVKTHNSNPNNVPLASKIDPISYALADKRGFNAKPQIGTIADIDNIALNGGTLTFRGMGKQIRFDTFKNGDNFLATGAGKNNMYGSGIYVTSVHNPPPTGDKAQKAHATLYGNGYSKPGASQTSSATARMVTSPDFKWGDQSKNKQDVIKLKSQLQKWLALKEIEAKTQYPVSAASAANFKPLTEKELLADPAHGYMFSKNRVEISTAFNSKLTVTPKKTKLSPSPTGNERFEIQYVKRQSKAAQYGFVTKINGKYYNLNPPGFMIEKIGNGRYQYTDRNGVNQTGTYKDIIAQAKNDHSHIEAIRTYNESLMFASKGGNSTVSPQAKKAIDEARKTYDRIAEVFIGDINDDRTSGRLAIIQGYDGLRLNESYHPKNFGTIFNRGKITVQNDQMDNNDLDVESRGTLK